MFITSENVRDGFLNFSPKKYLEKRFNEIQSRSILKKNDVLINIVGASIGRAALFDLDIENANINQAVAVIRLREDIIPKYVCIFLNSKRAHKLYNLMKKDVARANLSLENIGDIQIPVPPLEEQQRIVKEIETYEAAITAANSVLSACADKKKKILEKWL